MQDANRSAWDFAVQVYGRPGAREACLALQDRCGADIVALLALLHRAALGHGVMPEDRLAGGLALVASWREQAVLPLRRIRRALKGWRFGDDAPDPEAQSVRAAVAEAELAAERVELERLAACFAADDTSAVRESVPAVGGGAALLARYVLVAGLAVDGQDRAHLATLLGAAFPGSATEAMKLVDQAFGA
jgi:uncharacterized protein (TIGR02444 family)